MKIGLIKFCIPLDVEFYGNTSNSGTDDRYGFLKELVRRGHEVTIFTPLAKGTKNNPREERWITGEDENVPGKIKFLMKMGYAPGRLPVGDLKQDVIICEAGVGNMQFPNHYYPDQESPEASLIRRFVHVLNAHKGLVVYMHNDPSLPFYFRQIAGRSYPWGHKKNGYTNPVEANRREKWVRNSAWGTYDEIFSGKKSVVLTRCLPEQFDFMFENYSSDRAGYCDYKKELSFEYIQPAYAYDLCEGLKHRPAATYPLFYSGGDRRRRIAFRKNYEDMGVPTYVSGGWKEEAMAAFDGINFLGWLENREALLSHINKAGAVIQIQPKDASRMGWWTARPFEVVACRSMPFIDGSITRGSELVFDPYFVVKSKDDAREKLRAFLSMPFLDRVGLIETQLAYCRTMFNWQKFTDSFIAICNKHMDKSGDNARVPRMPYLDLTSGLSRRVGEIASSNKTSLDTVAYDYKRAETTSVEQDKSSPEKPEDSKKPVAREAEKTFEGDIPMEKFYGF